MALAQSKIYRALGGDMRLIHALCEEMAAMRSAQTLSDWVRDHIKDPNALPLSDQNWTDFRQGYFAKWQAVQSRSADLRARAATARQLISDTRSGGGSLVEAAQMQATAMLSEVLETFDVETLKETLAEKPAAFIQIVGSLSQLAQGEVARKALAAQMGKLQSDLTLAQAASKRAEEKLRMERESHAESLRLAREQIATLKQNRETAKAKLTDSIAALQKAAAAGTLNTKDNSALMAAIVETIKAM
jgi:hypothetical protein